ENRLSPSLGGPWDSWDVRAQISRKAARWSTQHLGQLGHRDARGAKSRTGQKNGKNFPKSRFAQSGTVRTKVREIRGSAGLAQVSPFRANRRYFSQAVWDNWDK
ncbi:hypothetical protein KI387_001870, partial [Taxus chinensis]